MNYIVPLSGFVNFAPANEAEEVLQNVRTILLSCMGTVPLDRDFSFTWEHIDKPLHEAKIDLKAAILDAIEEYEPRARVVSVKFENNINNALNGVLTPIVTIAIGEEEEEEI